LGILLAFAPFIVFAVVDRLAGGTIGLFAGATVSAALVLRDWIGAGRMPKILELGTVIVLGGLALYAGLTDPTWSIIGVRLRVDVGLLLIVLFSMALGRPFTLQYAREQVSPELWGSPIFIRVNYIITAVWAAAFAVTVISDFVLLYARDLTPAIGIAATALAIAGAFKFTSWYPKHVRANSGTLPH
jgi:hypothetical protein